MSEANRQPSVTLEPPIDLRLTGLIVLTPDVLGKDVLCVNKAIALVAKECQRNPADILRMPIDSSGPNLQERRFCDTVDLCLYGNNGYQRMKIEQVV